MHILISVFTPNFKTSSKNLNLTLKIQVKNDKILFFSQSPLKD